MCLRGLIPPKAETRLHVKETRPNIEELWTLVKDEKPYVEKVL